MLIDRCSALRATNLFQSNGTFEILYSQSISSCQIQFLKNNFIGLIKETNITKTSKQCKFCIFCLDKSFNQSGLSEWFGCQDGQGIPWAMALRWSRWSGWSCWSSLSMCFRWSRWSRWSMWSALMMRIQKMYGFHGLNQQIIEKSWDVTPVTNTHTHTQNLRL